MKETIVLYPAAVFDHMVSMVELGKLILHHHPHPHFSITILVSSMPWDTTTTTHTYINQTSQTNLPISFFSLPHLDPQDHDALNHLTPVAKVFKFMELNVPIVVRALQTMSLTSTIVAFITSAVQTSYEHAMIPTYNYFTSCASALAALLYLPTIHNQTTKSFKDLANTELHIPGLPPTLKASQMPQPILDRNSETYQGFLTFAASLPKSNGIILNTFDSLETTAIKEIGADGSTPPLYCIGPLVADAKDRAIGSNYGPTTTTHCLSLSWLDEQPSKSIVFLCFGSKGAFSAEQIKEVARGLERSDHRFLWVVRSQTDGTDLEEVLPIGFMERTKRRGLVVKSWAPQGNILRHDSIGGFVTHCGWNSVVEAVSAGVPMIAWPLYAEQHLNGLVLVEEMKLAIPINEKSCLGLKEEEKDGLVSATDVERRVRELMGGERGQQMRIRSLEMKEMAIKAWKNGGSSLASFSNLVASWNQP